MDTTLGSAVGAILDDNVDNNSVTIYITIN